MEFMPIFKKNRAYIEHIIGSVSDEQMLTMPDGFDNNIAWNLGHLIVAQQSLIYRQSSLETLTNRAHVAQFAPGTSPADWTTTPDLAALRALLTKSTEQMVADADAGLFQSYTPYTTTTGFHLATSDDAMTFNLYHDGLHFGAIMALRNLVRR